MGEFVARPTETRVRQTELTDTHTHRREAERRTCQLLIYCLRNATLLKHPYINHTCSHKYKTKSTYSWPRLDRWELYLLLALVYWPPAEVLQKAEALSDHCDTVPALERHLGQLKVGWSIAWSSTWGFQYFRTQGLFCCQVLHNRALWNSWL